MKAYILVKKEPLQKRKPIAFRYPANGSRRRPACLYLFIGIFLAACAQIAAPQGGSKDETAPLLLEATPASGSVNVTTSKVILEFDEFIALNDVFNQVLLSPPMSSIPDLVVKGKSIIMTFPDPFLENKTYTVNFGNAIKDQNEGNVLKNFQYVFSTGPVLDSLIIRGQVKDALESTPDKDMLVLLYSGDDRETPKTERPYYFARTDQSGSFTLTNLQAGQYQLMALADQNFNYLYDLPNEKIAFLDTLILVDTIQREYSLSTFIEQSGRGTLSRVKALRYGRIEATFSGFTDTNSIEIDGNPGVVKRWNTGKDTLSVWINDLTLDSLVVRQSLDTSIIEKRVLLKTISPDSLRKTNFLPLTPTLPISLKGKGEEKTEQTKRTAVSFDLGKELNIQLDNPAKTFYPERLTLRSMPSGDTVATKLTWKDSVKTIIHIDAALQSEGLYELHIDRSFAEDLYGLVSDSNTYLFQMRAKKDYGELIFNLELPKDRLFIIELLDAGGRVVKRQSELNSDNTKLSFPHLKPGQYKARIILDQNRNGFWDPGDYNKSLQSEPVLYFPDALSLRSDWILKFDWKPTFAQVPD
jgi:hypothetical protein